VPNDDLVTNLPGYAVVEVPILVDRSGLQPVRIGDIPPHLAALCHPHVAIQECFIRACLTGERDYVYQANMLDPHTASILTLDQIWQMTDELLAAEPHLLPKISRKGTRVPTSGKRFRKADPAVLRKAWYDKAAKVVENTDPVLQWSVIGPFSTDATKAHKGLAEKLAVEKDIAADGSLPTRGVYKDARANRRFRKVTVEGNGKVDLLEMLGRHEWCAAYAVGRIESMHDRDAELVIGSDDGVKVWLNGKVVHEIEVGRGYLPDQDRVRVRLRQGVNHLLVKIAQYHGQWEFSVAVTKPVY
jgi:hypothetical protein